MALNINAAASSSSSFLIPKNKHHFKLNTCCKAKSEGAAENDQDIPSPFSATRTRLDLLDQLTSSTPSSSNYDSTSRTKLTIREQLVQLVGLRDEDDVEQEFSIPLGKNLKKFSPKLLTVSQKRNIKRQAYLNEVSQRNDSVFFATIGAFVLLPPLIILGIAVFTGYVQLLP
ncbi:hypothetical protein M5689_000448 [Euphorbia peplus]|nr:hypothetical protein M5689_000448 [Euphorbia peplus]